MPRAAFFESLEDRKLLANVTVNLAQEFQTMQSIGGSYPMALYREVGQNAQGRYTLDNLKPEFNRTIIPVNFWEPNNDNSDPNSISSSGFKDEGKVHDVFLMMKDMESRGMKIVASVWDGPAWMIDGEEQRDKHTIPQSKEGEMVEAIAAFVQRAKNTYGVSIEYLSFNESNGGYKLLITPDQYNRIVKGVQERLASMGISGTKWVAGETFAVWGDTLDYIRKTLSNPDTRQHYGAVSYHSWWSENTPKAEWEAIYNLANEYGLPLWCGEVGYHGNEEGWEEPTSWANSERTAKTYHQIIGWSHATTTFHWTYQDNLTVVSPDLKPYSLFYVMKQLGDIWQSGTKVVGATSDSSSIWALAGKDVQDNRFVSQILNTSSSSNSVTLKGLPNKPLTLVRTRGTSTSVTEAAVTIGTYTPVNGTLTLNIAGDSFNTLTGELGVSAPPPGNTPPSIGSLGISPNPAAAGATVTLTANGVTDPDGPIEVVTFYRESNGTSGLQTGSGGDAAVGADSDETGGFSIQTSTSGLTGPVTYYAQATDRTTGVRGNAVSGVLSFQTAGGGAEVTLEAESAVVVGTIKSTKNTGYTGAGYVDFGTDAGDYVEWTHSNAEAGGRTLVFRYAHTGTARTMNLSINGAAAGTVSFTDTGGLTVWKTVEQAATLPAGSVKIRLTTGSAGGPNIDNLKIVGGTTPTDPPPPQDNGTYQAEAAVLSGAAALTGETGWTGTGYVDYSAATGGYVQWNNVYSAGGADRVIQFRFSNGGSTPRKLAIQVNGVAAGELTFPTTGGWAKWQTINFTVPVNSGMNVIKATTVGQNGPNLDSLTLLPGLAPPPPPPPVTYQAENFTMVGAVKSTKNSGYTGTGYADFGAISGQYIEFSVNITTAGQRTLQFRYAHDGSTRTMNLSVNGVASGTVSFASTGGLTIWKTVDKAITLPTGPVVLRLTTGSTGGPNIDSLTVI